MDFRVKFPIRFFPSHEQRLHSLTQGADYADACAQKLRSKAAPTFEKLYLLRTRLATISVAVVAIWLFVHVMLGANGMVVYRSKRSEYQELQKDIDRLQKENGQYNDQVNKLKSDPQTIEKEAREQFHYARPGEVIYVAPDPAPVPSTETHSANK